MGNLSQKFVSKKAVDKFCNLLDCNKIINWHYFGAAVINLSSKEHILWVLYLDSNYLSTLIGCLAL